MMGFYPSDGVAQDTLIKPLPIHLTDSLDYSAKNKGIIAKLLQSIKFRENRDNSEKERFYKYMQQLIEDGDLNINDSVLEVSYIIEVLQQKLDTINRLDSLKITSVDKTALNNAARIDSFAINQIPPPNQKPVEIAVNVRMNKVYNINTVNETYQVDGYINYTWKDERIRFKPSDSINSSLIYENDQVDNLIKETLWFPTIEFINIQGIRDIPNKQIVIDPDGTVYYSERFFGLFNAKMDFRQFPFDYQIYPLQVETFSYDVNRVVIANTEFFVNANYIGDDWQLIKQHARIMPIKYEYLSVDDPNEETYSRAVFELRLKRNPGYYIWQVLFPLLIIILASFAVFWIHDFGTQIGVGFTLMLTAVAFHFYSASLLPKLPYNTFIEYVFIIGYTFIFLAIIAIILNYRINRMAKEKNQDRLLRLYRYLFPLGYVISMVVLYTKIFVV